MSEIPDKLGKYGKDGITGFTGIVTGVTEHLFGCVRVVLEPGDLDEDGNPKKAHVFDEQRVTLQPRKKGLVPNCGQCDIQLGSVVKDTLTGFTGVAVAKTWWLNGPVDIGIEPTKPKKDGSPGDTHFFTAPRVEVVEAKKPEVAPGSSARTGGPSPLDRTRQH